MVTWLIQGHIMQCSVSKVTADASRAEEKGSVGAAWLTLVLSAAG